tara:strand:- start:1813 stop:2046 length:234 start_codon:yes stop_codon:yes gene_type:complete
MQLSTPIFPKGNIDREILVDTLSEIATNNDGILDMIVFGFVKSLSNREVKDYEQLLIDNFPNSYDKMLLAQLHKDTK